MSKEENEEIQVVIVKSLLVLAGVMTVSLLAVGIAIIYKGLL